MTAISVNYAFYLHSTDVLKFCGLPFHICARTKATFKRKLDFQEVNPSFKHTVEITC